MNNLKVILHNGQLVTDSREVAELIEKRHTDLLRSIAQYDAILTNAKMRSLDFFIPSSYLDAKGEERPCYLLTRKGCDMVANKMTGEKGVLFTATYVTKFEEMEKQLQHPKDSYMIEDSIERAKRWIQEQQERQSLEFSNKQKDQLIGELKPKADYMDTILRNPGLVTITQIAKDYGMSGEKLNSLLHDLGVQFKQSGQWLLYTKYQDKGYTHSQTIDITHSDGRPGIKMNTKWTQKGRLFLYDLLKEKEIMPIIERTERKEAI